jgi:autotransporter strand-loop-strand O-heptosyltransferase
LFFDDAENVWQPCDLRLVLEQASRPIAKPYVCIAAQRSTPANHWNNATGWSELVQSRGDSGYPVCIDREPVHCHGIACNHIPHNAEHQTGDRKLVEYARRLKHADFSARQSRGLARAPVCRFASQTPPVVAHMEVSPMARQCDIARRGQSCHAI